MTAGCLTSSAPASCSGTPRCCPACRPASRRAPPRTRSARSRTTADVIGPLLARPDFLAVDRPLDSRRPHRGRGARAAGEHPVQRPVETLIRTPPLVCSPDEPIREAAETDDRRPRERHPGPIRRDARHRDNHDLRSRVVAAGVSPDTPVSAIMNAPAHTVGAGSLVGDVLLDMLERGVHHVPVLSAAGEVLGVVDGGDLVAAEARGAVPAAPRHRPRHQRRGPGCRVGRAGPDDHRAA